MISSRDDAIPATRPAPIAVAAWRAIHAIRSMVEIDAGRALRWSPRNTVWLYLIAVTVGLALCGAARYWLHLVPSGKITVEGTVVTTVCMAIGALVGLITNQVLDVRRRGRGTIASTCPPTLGGLLSIELTGLLLTPMAPRFMTRPAVQIPREQIADVRARRTRGMQIELSATFVDGSTARYYVSRFDPLAQAWVDRSR